MLIVVVISLSHYKNFILMSEEIFYLRKTFMYSREFEIILAG